MSKLRSLAAILAAVAGCFMRVWFAEAAAPFHIGIMTGTVPNKKTSCAEPRS